MLKVVGSCRQEAAAQLAIIPVATSCHIGQAADADPEGAGGGIRHNVADCGVVHVVIGDYGSKGLTIGHFDYVSLILI